MKNYKTLLFYITTCLIAISCSKTDNFKKDKSGIEYQIIKGPDSKDKSINLNDVIIMNLSYELENGKLLFNSTQHERRYLRKITEAKHSGGSFEEGMLLLNIGDSAVFRINATNFLMYSESYKRIPEGISIDDNVIVKVKILGILQKEDYDELLTEQYHSSEEVEMTMLSKYLSNANILTEPTESGLYYIELTKGKGKQAKIGDFVSVFYSLSLIDGSLVETNLDKYPLNFKLGFGQVIEGWEEGISYMKEGGKAKLIIPSKLAYGANGNENILAYSTLIFTVELVSIK